MDESFEIDFVYRRREIRAPVIGTDVSLESDEELVESEVGSIAIGSDHGIILTLIHCQQRQ